jgi:small subunit ribosomal protein S6
MKRYETIYITRPDLEEDTRNSLQEKFKKIVEKGKGKVHVLENWGKMRLAYEVKRQLKGVYTYMGFEGLPNILKDLERNLRLTESVLKFQTVRIDGEFKAELTHPERFDRTDRFRGGDRKDFSDDRIGRSLPEEDLMEASIQPELNHSQDHP